MKALIASVQIAIKSDHEHWELHDGCFDVSWLSGHLSGWLSPLWPEVNKYTDIREWEK